MSYCIEELHLGQMPFVVQQAPKDLGWRAVCDCGKPTVIYVLISGALAEQHQHSLSHRMCAA